MALVKEYASQRQSQLQSSIPSSCFRLKDKKKLKLLYSKTVRKFFRQISGDNDNKERSRSNSHLFWLRTNKSEESCGKITDSKDNVD